MQTAGGEVVQFLHGVEKVGLVAQHADLRRHDDAQLCPRGGDVAVLTGVRQAVVGKIKPQPAHVLPEPADIAVKVTHDAIGEYEPLEQRVGGQPVGAVDAGAGDLAAGI